MKNVADRRRHSQEGGFALLVVFLLAAAIAISLYMEIPRVAFETQRDRELLTVERAQEYQRAVQLFVRANKRYPSKLEDLENFNDKRYLRHRFVDPLTGKDDWRLIHVGPNGMLTDSLVKKNNNPLGSNDDKDKDKDQQASSTDPNAAGTDPNAAAGGPLNLAKTRRPGDYMAGQLPQMGSTVPGAPGTDPSQPQQPFPPPGTTTGTYPPQPGQPYPYPQQPGQPYPYPQQPGQPVPGQYPPQPGQTYQYPPQPGQPVVQYPQTGQPPLPPGVPYPGQPGQVPYPQPGQPVPVPPVSPYIQPGQVPYPQPGQPVQYPQPGQMPPGVPYPQNPGQPTFQPVQPYQQNPQAPYPTPYTGRQPTPGPTSTVPQGVTNSIFGGSSSAFNNPQPASGGMGAGIAGVGIPAEYKGEGILVVKDRSKYREWEFVYDPKEDKTIVGAAAAAQNAGAMQQNPLGPQTPPPQTQQPPR